MALPASGLGFFEQELNGDIDLCMESRKGTKLHQKSRMWERSEGQGQGQGKRHKDKDRDKVLTRPPPSSVFSFEFFGDNIIQFSVVGVGGSG
jgi:hypothetical protein